MPAQSKTYCKYSMKTNFNMKENSELVIWIESNDLANRKQMNMLYQKKITSKYKNTEMTS